MNRRQASWLLASAALARTKFRDDPFTLGIASGEPWPDGFVLWTRLAPESGPPSGPVAVEWRVATDEKMAHVVRSGAETAQPNSVHSVHAEIRGLEPDRWYWYPFSAG